ANNKEAVSGCADEPVKIAPETASTETLPDAAPATLGVTFKDTATLSGLPGALAGGMVSFKLIDNKTCDASEGGLIASDGPVAVDGNGEYSTPHGASPPHARTSFPTRRSSDLANNKEAVSGCADEPVVIAAKPVPSPPPAVAVLPLQVISG